jgi:hypothetical protein
MGRCLVKVLPTATAAISESRLQRDVIGQLGMLARIRLGATSGPRPWAFHRPTGRSSAIRVGGSRDLPPAKVRTLRFQMVVSAAPECSRTSAMNTPLARRCEADRMGYRRSAVIDRLRRGIGNLTSRAKPGALPQARTAQSSRI